MHWNKVWINKTCISMDSTVHSNHDRDWSVCVCTAKIPWFMGAYLQCSTNEVNHCWFFTETVVFFVHMEEYKERTKPW